MKLSVIIPSFNGGAILAEHLPEVCAQVETLGEGAEVIVVDDASTLAEDTTEQMVSQSGSVARLVRQEKNLGFASTCNLGARQARGELLLFLNNDMHPEPGAVQTLVEQFEDQRSEGLFALCPVIVNLEEGFAESTNRALFRRGVFDLEFPGRDGLPAPGPGQMRELAYACGGAMICRKDQYVTLGGFPEVHSPFYWEDADLGMRAARLGLSSKETGAARVLHDHSRTIGAIYTRRQVRRIYERNRLLFTWIHLEGARAWSSHLMWLLPRWAAALLRARPGALALPMALLRLGRVRRERAHLARLLKTN